MSDTKLSQKLAAFASKLPGEESILWSFYHYKNLAASAVPSPLTFFNVSQGQQDSDVSATATPEDTNMIQPNSLQNPQRFLIQRICAPVVPSTASTIPVGDQVEADTESRPDDLVRLIYRGYFVLTIMTKPYLQIAPIGQLGAGYGVAAALAAATTDATVTTYRSVINNGVPSREEGYKVALPLAPQVAFNAQISFPKATLTLAQVIRLGVVLHGVLFRPENS
jgi:hypothetical protein